MRFVEVARFAKAAWSSSLAMRSAVASKFSRKGRSTVTSRKPNSRFSKVRETMQDSVSPFSRASAVSPSRYLP